jgi:hypothetical protein
MVDITGIDDHEMSGIPIGTAGAVVQSHKGPVIAILNEYALHGHGKTIHSSGQLEHYKLDVDDRSKFTGGKQRIKTIDGYVFPINIVNGLAYTSMRPYTDQELDELPHVIWTSQAPWDPACLDETITDKPNWFDQLGEDIEQLGDSNFDCRGNYLKREAETHLRQAEIKSLEFLDINAQDKYCMSERSDLMYDRTLYEDRLTDEDEFENTSRRKFQVYRRERISKQRYE